jgi:prepilin-type N-terminal cleavage/methylation domain-containing protein
MPRPSAKVQGFTLIEIMIAIVIIGLLAALAVPAVQRLKQRSLATLMANDFRQIKASFERSSLEMGRWPPAAGAGVTPLNMDGMLPTAYAMPAPVGGQYSWSGPTGRLVLSGGPPNDTVMKQVDTILDDGNLETGSFMGLGAGTYQLIVR